MSEWGTGGQIVGGLLAVMGIFLPGTFLIFFVSKFWEDVKGTELIKASLEGINAVSSGLVIAATLYLLEPYSRYADKLCINFRYIHSVIL